MAEKVLKVKTVSEVAEAISGLTDLQGSLKGVGTAAFEAAGKSKAEWKALGAEWEKSTAAAAGVAEQAFKVESALNAMGRASSQPQLESSLVKSQVEFRRLQNTIREVAATGGTIDDGVVAGMNVMRASIDAGKAKLNELKTTTEAAKRELGLLGDSAKRAGTATGEVTGKTEKLGDSMRKSTEGVNKFRGAAMETWAVLQIGVDAGKALAAAIDKYSERMAAADKKVNDAAVNTIKFQQAMKLAEKGLITMGGTQEQFLARYDAYVQKTSPATKATEAQTKALKEQEKAWADLGAKMQASAKTVEFKINAPKIDEIMPLEEATKYGERLNEILAKAYQEGGVKEQAAWAQANTDTLDRVLAAYEKWGLNVPTYVKTAYDAMKEASTDWIAVLDAENAAADAAYQAKLDRWAKEDAAANRTSKAPDEYKAIQDAAFGAAVANGELGTSLDRVAEAVVATGGTMTVGAPILITITEASEEATAALLRQAEAWGVLTKAQSEHMGATKGWTDYVLAMKDAYEAGTSSLYNYITGLSAFKTQLLQMYAGATGAAKEAVDAMVALIEKLMQTAGGRDTGSGNSNVDNLNRALERDRG